MKIEGLLEGMRAGKTPALAKAISLVENARAGFEIISCSLSTWSNKGSSLSSEEARPFESLFRC